MTKKKPGAPGVHKHQPHRCGKKCKHACGESGGITKRGKLCKRITGKLGRCTLHGGPGAGRSLNAFAGDPIFDGLTAKEVRFVLAFCGDANGNQTEAAKMAGFGTTRPSSQVSGSKLMATEQVKEAIRKYFDSMSASSEEILKRLTDDARVNMAGLIHFVSDGAGGKMAKLNLTPENLQKYGCLIKEIETDGFTGLVRKVKLVDGQMARRDLAKIRRLFTDTATEVNLYQLHDLEDREVVSRLQAARDRLTPQHHHGAGNGK